MFDYKALEKVAYENMYLCDDLIDLELEHVDEIIAHIKENFIDDDRNELELWEKVHDTGKSSRRAGCGATGPADAVAKMGIKLNSEKGFDAIRKMFRAKMLGELKAQVDLAKERGTFKGYSFDKEYEKLPDGTLKGKNRFFQRIYDEFGKTNPELFEDMEKYGRRNVSWSTMAPVGTGAIMTQGTSGVEPLFTPYGKRRKKCMSKTDRVDYVDNVGEKFTVFNIAHRPLLEWIMENCPDYDKTKTFDEQATEENKEKWFKASPWYGCTSNDLTPEEHIRLQSDIQYFTSHSLSKTCSLPNTATEEEISEIYLKGWEQDCKGVTVYRDGCRSGVLIKEEKKNEDANGNKPVTTLTHSAPKRPKSLPCEIKRFRNGGDKWVACVGLYNGEPYEIFTGLAERLNLPEYVDKCVIIKNKVDRMMFNPDTEKEEMMKVSSYDIVYTDKDGNIVMIEDVSNIFRSEFYAIAKLTSGLLRHGMPIEHLISTIKSIDFKNETINSWKQGVIRTLKKYLKDDGPMDTSERCPECGAKVVRENGCKHCSECGWSACQ